jgi:ketopantoate hydroxymethyltransferase
LKETGLKEGEAIGLEKGKQEEKIDNARKMKECGVGINIISIVTGLSADEIWKKRSIPTHSNG